MRCSDDAEYMRLAIEEARKAAEAGEVPVGVVLADADGEVLACTHNLCETHKLPTAHAEMLAIEQACTAKSGWRLSDCTLYVTLEPCPMCMGALIHARVGKIVFGAADARAGACGSLIDLTAYPLESRPDLISGVLEEECRELLRSFFRKKEKVDSD